MFIFIAIKDGNGVELKTTTKASLNDYISTQEPWESIPAFKSLWVYRPPSLVSAYFLPIVNYNIYSKVCIVFVMK